MDLFTTAKILEVPGLAHRAGTEVLQKYPRAWEGRRGTVQATVARKIPADFKNSSWLASRKSRGLFRPLRPGTNPQRLKLAETALGARDFTSEKNPGG